MPYPRYKEISKDALFTWFDDVIQGKVSPKTDSFATEGSIKDTEITS